MNVVQLLVFLHHVYITIFKVVRHTELIWIEKHIFFRLVSTLLIHFPSCSSSAGKSFSFVIISLGRYVSASYGRTCTFGSARRSWIINALIADCTFMFVSVDLYSTCMYVSSLTIVTASDGLGGIWHSIFRRFCC